MQLLEIFSDKEKLKQLEEDIFYGKIGLIFANESGTSYNNTFTNLTESFCKTLSSLSDRSYYHYIVNEAENFYKSHNKKIDLDRSKILAYPSTFDGIIHKDHEKQDCLTTITFLNSNWDPTWGGEILCYSNDLKVVIGGVTPQFGKTFAFNGGLPHRAVAPVRVSSLLRIVLATKELI